MIATSKMNSSIAANKSIYIQKIGSNYQITPVDATFLVFYHNQSVIIISTIYSFPFIVTNAFCNALIGNVSLRGFRLIITNDTLNSVASSLRVPFSLEAAARSIMPVCIIPFNDMKSSIITIL